MMVVAMAMREMSVLRTSLGLGSLNVTLSTCHGPAHGEYLRSAEHAWNSASRLRCSNSDLAVRLLCVFNLLVP